LEEGAAHLEQVQLQRREALSAAGAYESLRGAHLAIIDPDALVGTPQEHAQLEAALQGSTLVTVSGREFMAQAERYLEQAVAATGLGQMLPPRRVAFTAWAGGVGRSTLALASGRTFAEATHLPTAVVELTPGPSALRALTNTEGPDLYHVLEQEEAYPIWEGVTLALMDWSVARLLDPQQILTAWQELATEHIYVAYDAPAWHPLFDRLSIDTYVVLADARADAQVEAVALLEDLDRANGATTYLGLNRGGLAGRVSLPRKPDLQLRALRDPMKVGTDVLRLVYPGWRVT
jgi:hypothetical protein